MIVNYTEKGWKIITQRSHGLLSMQLGMNWNEHERPSRWAETLVAIAEHDDAEVELDGETLLTEAGGPLNFNMKQFDLKHCMRLFQMSLTKSRYVALLTSYHMDFLYRKEAKNSAECRAFFNMLTKKQKQWSRELKINIAEIKNIYSFLEWCDAFSLIICQDLMQPEKRSLEISQGPDNKTYHLFRVSNNKLSVLPWNFAGKSFTVSYEYRLLEQVSFASAAEFRKCFLDAPVTEVIYEVVKTARFPKEKKV